MSTGGGAAPDRAAGDGTAVDGIDVDAVAAAARACPAVADLHGAGPAWAATYLPGRRVDGVRIEPDAVVLQVVGRWGVPIRDLVTQVRTSVRPLAGGRRVDLVLAGLADPPPEAHRPDAHRPEAEFSPAARRAAALSG